MSGAPSCAFCERAFRARETGGRAQRFCRPSCRRAFHAAVRSWSLDAIAEGALTIEEIKNRAPATRTLRGQAKQLLPYPEIGFSAQGLPDPLTRFLVEIPQATIGLCVMFGFIRPDQRDDLGAIMAGLRRLGQVPAISRIA
jgi:hypothetical protein